MILFCVLNEQFHETLLGLNEQTEIEIENIEQARIRLVSIYISFINFYLQLKAIDYKKEISTTLFNEKDFDEEQRMKKND